MIVLMLDSRPNRCRLIGNAMSPSAHAEAPKRKTQLRSSCNACAASKIGCTKEKPACQRCLKRGEDCIYGAARRAGRPSEHKQQNRERRTSRTTSPQAQAQLEASSEVLQPFPTRLDHGNGNGSNAVSEPIYKNGEQFAPLTTDDAAGSLHALPTTLSTPDFGSFLASLDPGEDYSPLDFSHLDATNFGLKPAGLKGKEGGMPMDTTDQRRHTRMDSAVDPMCPRTNSLVPASTEPPLTSTDSFSWMEPMDWSLPPLTTGHSTTSAFTSSPQNLSMDPSQTVQPQTCGCAARTTSLIRALTPDSTNDVTTDRPNLETVVSRNEAALRETSNMLDCACACNDALLLDLSSVVLRALGWYAAIVCTVAGQDHSPTEGSRPSQDSVRWTAGRAAAMLSGISQDTQQQGRMVCHMLLSKLDLLKSVIADVTMRLRDLDCQEGHPELSHIDRMARTAQDLLTAHRTTGPSANQQSARTLDKELRDRFADLCKALVSLLQEW